MFPSDRDGDPIWHPFTPVPIEAPREMFTRAEGSYVFDRSGKRYFDATSSWWCNLHGHCHPRLVEALHRQASRLDQILLAPHTNEAAHELAGALLAKAGSSFSKVFYSDDGSTAVESALKMALQYWRNKGVEGKKRFLSLDLSYHGDTLGAVAVGNVALYHDTFHVMPLGMKSPAPYCYRCPLGKTYPQCEAACVWPFEQLLETHHRELAGVILEPLVQGAGGMIVYPEEVLRKMVSACRKYDVLLILDEVFTGFGRTGNFFAMDVLEQKPDLVCLSKGLTSGMLPMAATLASPQVFEAFCGNKEVALYHGHTFTGNALGAAVALESLKIFEDENVLGRNEKLSAVFREAKPRFLEIPLVGDVRHVGMIFAVELVTDRATKAIPHPANGPGWAAARELWEQGYWFRPLGNVIYVVPPYSTTPQELRDCLSVLYASLMRLKEC